jgi:hypothetical protein
MLSVCLYTVLCDLVLRVPLVFDVCILQMSSVDTAAGWIAEVWFSIRERDFSLLHSSAQIGRGALPASYPLGTGCKTDRDMTLATHLDLVSRTRMMELCLHSPIRLNGMVLNKRAGTTWMSSRNCFSLDVLNEHEKCSEPEYFLFFCVILRPTQVIIFMKANFFLL